MTINHSLVKNLQNLAALYSMRGRDVVETLLKLGPEVYRQAYHGRSRHSALFDLAVTYQMMAAHHYEQARRHMGVEDKVPLPAEVTDGFYWIEWRPGRLAVVEVLHSMRTGEAFVYSCGSAHPTPLRALGIPLLERVSPPK